MDRIKKNFGFGCMRLPMIGEEVDIEQTKQMVDAFLDAGFNYFDTAHGYIQGKSEKALKTCLTSRYPREKYILTDKLTANYFKTDGIHLHTLSCPDEAAFERTKSALRALRVLLEENGN